MSQFATVPQTIAENPAQDVELAKVGVIGRMNSHHKIVSNHERKIVSNHERKVDVHHEPPANFKERSGSHEYEVDVSDDGLAITYRYYLCCCLHVASDKMVIPKGAINKIQYDHGLKYYKVFFGCFLFFFGIYLATNSADAVPDGDGTIADGDKDGNVGDGTGIPQQGLGDTGMTIGYVGIFLGLLIAIYYLYLYRNGDVNTYVHHRENNNTCMKKLCDATPYFTLGAKKAKKCNEAMRDRLISPGLAAISV